MKKLWILLGLMFVLALSSVMGANCNGTISDQSGCTFAVNVTQTTNIAFSGYISGSYHVSANTDSLTWDCNGYSLSGLGNTTGTMFGTYLADVRNIRIKNCDISDVGKVWYFFHPVASGTTTNNFLETSKVNNVNVTMFLDANAYNGWTFAVSNNGINRTNISNTNYGIISRGFTDEDCIGSAVFTNNKMYGGLIGVRLGDVSGLTRTTGQDTFNNWVINNNEFHGQNNASVWVMNGKNPSLASITNNIFNGTNSGLITERSVTISGNTFLNGAKGQNGCVMPPTEGYPLIMITSTIPICSGTYNQTDTIYTSLSTKVYPSGGIGTLTLQDYGAGTSVSTQTQSTGISKDNVEIYGIHFKNFTNSIYAMTDCDFGSSIYDTLDNWNIHDNVFTDLSKQTGTSTGINWIQDAPRYCFNSNMVMRDNVYNDLNIGINFGVGNNAQYGLSPYSGTNEISFSDFNNVTEGIKENGLVWNSNFIIVFNTFNITNNTVQNTGFDWFGNSALGGSYIQDQNTCQKPDLAYLVDDDVTYCSGSYVVSPSWQMLPFAGVTIYCDGTEIIDDALYSSAGVMIQPFTSNLVSFYKLPNANGITLEGCTFTNFSSGVQIGQNSIGSGGSNGANNVIKNNTFKNSRWGIYLGTSSTGVYNYFYNWNIYNNRFVNLTDEGIYMDCQIGTPPNNGVQLHDIHIYDNYFDTVNYGVKAEGCEYSVSTCGSQLYNIDINDNEFHNNLNHIRIEHPDPVQCPTQSPINVTAHQNIFARDFTAFAVSNTHALSYDFTLNNWGTGFTGIIDQAIFDDGDVSTYGVINYIPIIGYTLFYGSPFAVQENWESAVSTDSESVVNLPITYQATGYDNLKNFIGNENWLLARSNANARGTVYLSNDAVCLSNYCYKSQVDSLDINPQYARVTRFFPQTVNMTTDTAIRFKVLYNSTYWDSGGALIFRKEDDSIAFKIDLGLTNETNYATATNSNVCRIKDIAGLPVQVGTKNNDVWYSFDISLLDIQSACPVYANIFTNAKRIDRAELVFGGKTNGVLGDVIWYVDDIEVENVDFNSPPANIPPSGSFINFQEPFGSGFNFDIIRTDCLESGDGFSDTQFGTHTPQYVGGDNDWICWINSTGGSPTIHYEDSSDTLHISSDLGIMHTVTGSVNPTISSWASSGNYNIDMSGGDADHFLFTCDMSNQSNSYSYLLYASNTVASIDETKAGYISLKNGGCAYNSSLPYQDDIYDADDVPCCELIAIVGEDCTGGKTAIDFSEQDMEDSCGNDFGADLSTIDIDRLEFVTLKRTTGADQVFFDDLYLYNTGFIGGNSLPSITTMDCVPDPVDVSSPASCGVGIMDTDNPATETYSAFDCDTSTPSLDYGWALRGQTPVFSCTFGTENTFTQKLWVSDLPHYPTYNVSGTSTTTALLVVTPPHPSTGGSCSLYSPQTCTGNCVFTDNFNYDLMIMCAGWSGQTSDYHPTSNVMSIFGTDIYDENYEIDKTTTNSIKSSQVISYEIKFDVRMKTTDTMLFIGYNDELNKNTMYLAISNYNLVAYKQTGSLSMGSVTPNTWTNIKASVNYQDYKVYYYKDDVLIGTIDLYESGVTSSRKFQFFWSDTDMEFDVDNFRINVVQYSENYTNITETPTIDYTYNPDLFCAINWTNPNTDKFTPSNCDARGFSTQYPLVGLCIPRACIQDVGLMMLNWATANIFRTIIIVTAFILIAPLLVALMRKGR